MTQGDLTEVGNAVYKAVSPITEGILEHGYKHPCNGHHMAQKVVVAVLDYLKGDSTSLNDFCLLCEAHEAFVKARQK